MIQLKNLYILIDPEPYAILFLMLLLAWIFYKLFLKEISEERHQNLKAHFKNILRHFLMCSVLFSLFIFISQLAPTAAMTRFLPYLGILTLGTGMIVFVKTCRLIILQYLFLGSMKVGVPVLIVNLFSLLLSLALLIWTANQIFGIQVAPLLATSAAFSIILGLALQDTLGNLFAGLSLQLDKSFEIGDWVEVINGPQKISGQVKEISWRATLLIGLSEEKITLPNRSLASSQISNFSDSSGPIVRSQIFKIPYSHSSDLVKQCLLESIKESPQICSYPAPLVLITESHESWVLYKLIYFIEDYGLQYGIGDQVIDSAIKYLAANQIEISPPRIKIIDSSVASL